ncbi:MAG TPA: hypothetical protein VJU79_05895, partial [Candidatus Dormibacteraeota bacterium]|nr:hypothetical protein [Candidatus Dormibacteraeota bacterium]
TYPGAHTITGSYTPTAPGTITLDVPVADVSPAIPIDQTLYSLTAATMLLQRPANSVPAVSGIGGEPFDLIDVAAPFDLPANPSTDVPEGLTALLAGTALLAVTGASVWRRRRRGIAAA